MRQWFWTNSHSTSTVVCVFLKAFCILTDEKINYVWNINTVIIVEKLHSCSYRMGHVQNNFKIQLFNAMNYRYGFKDPFTTRFNLFRE